MKFLKIMIVLILLTPVVFLYGCDEEKDYTGYVKVVFEPEGGKYQNCTRPFYSYYEFSEGTMNLIKNPIELSEKEIGREGYFLAGWFRTKTVDGDNVTYSDEWDFETDRVGSEDLTLYAYWKKNVNHIYEVCYTDDKGAVQVLGEYNDMGGKTFDDYEEYATRIGYTVIGYLDEEGNDWNKEYTHPGGEEDLTVRVFAKYIKGTYAVVDSVSGLKANKNKNIYLAGNIDMEGEEFSFNGYKGTFLGNGYTISNFKINYSASKSSLVADFEEPGKNSLCISLFGNIDGAKIENVTFENVTLDVETQLSSTYKIYVAPIAMKTTNSELTNVNFQGEFKVVKLPTDFNIDENLIFITDKAAYLIDSETVIENCEINVTSLMDSSLMD